MNLLPEDQVDAGQAYDGLGNSEIIDTAFENKIWQLSKFAALNQPVSVDIDGKVYAEIRQTKYFIGKIPNDKVKTFSALYLNDKVELWVSIHGGTYKQTSTRSDGSITVKTYRDPVTLKLIAEDQQPAKTLNNNSGEEWSEVGKKMYAAKRKPYCLNCKHQLKGERFCPNCGAKIIYPGEHQNGMPINSWEKVANGADKFLQSVDKTGKFFSDFGCAMTLGCTIPIIIIIIPFGLI
jgi:hypothetical protein